MKLGLIIIMLLFSGLASAKMPDSGTELFIVTAWNHYALTNSRTGEKSAFAVSSMTPAVPALDNPYEDVQAFLGVGCDSKSEWTYIGFTVEPNLAEYEFINGGVIAKAGMNWGYKFEDVDLYRKSGKTSFLHYKSHKDSKIIKKIARAKSVLLDLIWWNHQKADFRFSLKGSSAAITNIRALCASYRK